MKWVGEGAPSKPGPAVPERGARASLALEIDPSSFSFAAWASEGADVLTSFTPGLLVWLQYGD